MKPGSNRLLASALLACVLQPAYAQQPAASSSVEERLRRLEERQAAYERELDARDARIRELEAQLARQDEAREPPTAATTPPPSAPAQPAPAAADTAVATATQPAPTPNPASAGTDEPFGLFTPGRGFTVARTDWGELQISLYTYLRYLNQEGLDDSYVDHFGNVRDIDIRNDLQINKVFLYTQGWFLDPAFRYTFYVWASGPALGSANSILAAGNLTYTFNDAFTLGGGVLALPSTRSMDGQFPYWQRVDARMIADEFMRGGFTQGIWANGALNERLNYKLGLGNNLSAFGVSAGRLDDRMDTWAAALTWMPTTGEFGPRANFGDFEQHEDLATLFSVHLTGSTEDRESQPGLIDPENTQIRLSSGTTVFTPNALGDGITVDTLDYRMLALSAGMKYRGFYLEAEAYRRWLDDFRTTGGPSPYERLVDDGFQLQGSMMLVPQSVQLYLNGSKIWGEFGDPWDAGMGVNWWPYRTRGFRFNGELMYVRDSPVGSPSYPFPIGATGWVFHANAEVSF